MTEDYLFTLNLEQIVFDENRFPRYPTLIDYETEGLGDLKPDPALRSLPFARSGGPFQVIFSLDPDGSAQFKVNADGSFELHTLDGLPVADPLWQASVDSQHLTCTVTWQGTHAPETQVLRLDCTPDPEDPQGFARFLFLGLVNTSRLETRTTHVQQPPVRSLSPELTVEGSPEFGLVFTMYRPEAYAELTNDYRFEPALRIRRGAPLQFNIVLGPSSGLTFGTGVGSPGTDEVPVKLPMPELQDGKGELLMPTQRPTSQDCIVTWNQNRARLELGTYVVFNLQLANPDKADPHTLDPTIIEEPPAAPPVNGIKH